MQAEEKGTDTGSNKTQLNEPSRPNKEHISGGKNSGEENSEREMSGNSHESHEERGHKPAGNMVHEIHAGDQGSMLERNLAMSNMRKRKPRTMSSMKK